MIPRVWGILWDPDPGIIPGIQGSLWIPGLGSSQEFVDSLGFTPWDYSKDFLDPPPGLSRDFGDPSGSTPGLIPRIGIPLLPVPKEIKSIIGLAWISFMGLGGFGGVLGDFRILGGFLGDPEWILGDPGRILGSLVGFFGGVPSFQSPAGGALYANDPALYANEALHAKNPALYAN